MTASLPMYDFPELRDSTDAWWAGIARHMRARGLSPPSQLLHDHTLRSLWDDPNLFFTQCCGFDLVHRYQGIFETLITPHSLADMAQGDRYCSVIIVRESQLDLQLADFAGSRAVINGWESHSGMNAFFTTVQTVSPNGQRFFSEILESGSHADSINHVREAKADIAAIDCTTWHLLNMHRPNSTAGLGVLCQSRYAPNLPYVTRQTLPEETKSLMRSALMDAFKDPDLAGIRQSLAIGAYSVLPTNEYQSIVQDFSYSTGLTGVV